MTNPIICQGVANTEMITLSEAIDHYLVHLANLCEVVKCQSKDIIPYNGHTFGEIHVEAIVSIMGTTKHTLDVKIDTVVSIFTSTNGVLW